MMRIRTLALLAAILTAGPALAAQDMLLGGDMTSDKMTKAEMTRADVEGLIAKAGGRPVDLPDKSLSGLDLSGLDLKGANMRTARLNGTNLKGTVLSGASLQQA
ncbi:pentapeptide repeat-containing protein [Methylobacterium haplocladii]